MKFLIFTDGGAYRPPGNNKTFDAFSGVRLHVKVDKNTEPMLVKYVGMSNNQTMAYAEMYAIKVGLGKALEHFEAVKKNGGKIPKDSTVHLFTDSMNCYMTLNSWIYSWIKKAGGVDKEFKSSKGEVVKNQEVIRDAFQILNALKKKGVNVKLFHVYSHLLEGATKQKKKKMTMDDFHKKFMLFNKQVVTKEEFMFILKENKACDDDLTKYAKEYYEKQKQNKV